MRGYNMSMYAGTNYVPKIFIGNKKVNEMYVGNDKKFHFVDTLKRTNEASGNAIIRQKFATTSGDAYYNSFWSDGTALYQQPCSDYSLTFLMFDTIAKKWAYKDFYGFTSGRINSMYIWTDGDNIYYSYGTTNYVLDKATDTWNVKTWSGLTNLYGYDIWTDGDNIYYSHEGENYVLDKTTNTWNVKTWKGLTDFYGQFIWTDGDSVYYSDSSDHYILNKATNTWNVKTWNVSINGLYVWTDGDNVYHSNGNQHYVLDRSTDTWNVKGWNEKIYGRLVWSDGNDFYHTSTNGQTLLYNKQDTSWSLITMDADIPRDIVVDSRNFWSDGNSLYYTGEGKTYIVQDMNTWIKKDAWNNVIYHGRYVWTDGEDVYYSTGSSSGQLILDKINDVWSKKTWSGSNNFWGDDVWSDGENTYCYIQTLGMNYKTYVLDKANNTWNVKVWKGLDAFSPDSGMASCIWCDGDNTYYSYRESQYIFNKNTNLWERKIWSGSFYPAYGYYVWFDGDDIYYSDKDNYQWQLKYNRNSDTWEKINWKNSRACNGVCVWSDGDNTYYSNGDTQWILSKTQQYTWNDISPWYCQGSPLEYRRFDTNGSSRDYTWTDGSNIYYTYSYGSNQCHYMWDDTTLTWTQKTIPFSGFVGYDVWTDEDNIYYSMVNNKHYVLNKATGSWSVKTWNGLTSFYGRYIWTDGDNIYYSHEGENYVLDKTTNTWNVKTWAGLTNFDGTYIWTDGDDIYYSKGRQHYVLDRATNTWNVKTWDLGSLLINGNDVFNVNGVIICAYNNYYYGSGLYKFNKNTKQWENFTWYRYNDSGNLVSFNIEWGQCVWDTGSTLRYDYTPEQHFQLYVENNVYIWKPLTSFISIKLLGNKVWSDDENTYGISTDNSETTEMILDKQSNRWFYMNSKEINSGDIWHDHNYNLYCSTDGGRTQYAFNKVTHTWNITEWNIPVYDVWYNGTDIYCWYNNKAYMLNPNTNMWEYVSTYGVIDDIRALSIWNDNGKLYSITDSRRYMYNDSNDIWEPIDAWSGYNDFYGSYIWSDGDNIYCTGQVTSNGSTVTRQYVFDSTLKRWNKKTWLGGYGGFTTKPYIYNNTLYVSNIRKNYTFST